MKIKWLLPNDASLAALKINAIYEPKKKQMGTDDNPTLNPEWGNQRGELGGRGRARRSVRFTRQETDVSDPKTEEIQGNKANVAPSEINLLGAPRKRIGGANWAAERHGVIDPIVGGWGCAAILVCECILST